MADQYEGTGSTYSQFRDTAPLVLPERHSFFRLADRVQDLRILDLACGTGFYTRELKRRGAASVLGVDISADMVRLAREQEQQEHLGVEYQVHDATALPHLGDFDLVTAVYLFNYAASRDTLRRMFQGIYANLKPGGRLIAATINPSFRLDGPNWTEYGLTILSETREGEHVRCQARFNIQPPILIEYFKWSTAEYEEALQQAGFVEHQWHAMQVPSDARKYFGDDFWRAYEENPAAILLTCRK